MSVSIATSRELHGRRATPTGTMVTESGASIFYTKYDIIPIEDSPRNSKRCSVDGNIHSSSLPSSSSAAAAAMSAAMTAAAASGGSVRVRKLTPLRDGVTRFPKLDECAHFHYEFVELQPIELSLVDDGLSVETNDSSSEQWYDIIVRTGGRALDEAGIVGGATGGMGRATCGMGGTTGAAAYNSGRREWTIRRSYDSLHHMDQQLHRCIFDRNYSRLPEMSQDLVDEIGATRVLGMVASFLTRFSDLNHNMINCGPVLSWLEMDNRGNRLVASDNDCAINVPAIGAAHAVKPYTAQTPDELSFEVGDMLSIIDKPPMDESGWWRGKKGFTVGYFPADCVEIIGEKVPQAVATKIPETTKPVLRKRGKLISFLRTFFTSRPARTQLKRTGIVRERVFGCDLGEHLLNSSHDVPLVLKTCADVIESHGIVDGIYRLSGVASNIQRLRNIFDEDQAPPALTDDILTQDVHSVSSMLKMYFRELPNPLLTYQLYDQFVEAVSNGTEQEKLQQLSDIVQQLPPPHYRTAAFLIKHLSRVAVHETKTGMHCKNLAIVWAPNLLKCKELEQMQCSAAVLRGVGVQAIVTEYLIRNADTLFDDLLHPVETTENSTIHGGGPPRYRPATFSNTTRLLSLEEAQERERAHYDLPDRYIDVGGGPAALPAKYHTVIELPKSKRNRKSMSPSSWRRIFSRGRSSSLKDEQQATELKSSGGTIRGRSADVGNNSLLQPANDLERKMHSEGSLMMTQSALYDDSSAYVTRWPEVKRKSMSCDIPLISDSVSASYIPAPASVCLPPKFAANSKKSMSRTSSVDVVPDNSVWYSTFPTLDSSPAGRPPPVPPRTRSTCGSTCSEFSTFRPPAVTPLLSPSDSTFTNDFPDGGKDLDDSVDSLEHEVKVDGSGVSSEDETWNETPEQRFLSWQLESRRAEQDGEDLVSEVLNSPCHRQLNDHLQNDRFDAGLKTPVAGSDFIASDLDDFVIVSTPEDRPASICDGNDETASPSDIDFRSFREEPAAANPDGTVPSRVDYAAISADFQQSRCDNGQHWLSTVTEASACDDDLMDMNSPAQLSHTALQLYDAMYGGSLHATRPFPADVDISTTPQSSLPFSISPVENAAVYPAVGKDLISSPVNAQSLRSDVSHSDETLEGSSLENLSRRPYSYLHPEYEPAVGTGCMVYGGTGLYQGDNSISSSFDGGRSHSKSQNCVPASELEPCADSDTFRSVAARLVPAMQQSPKISGSRETLAEDTVSGSAGYFRKRNESHLDCSSQGHPLSSSTVGSGTSAGLENRSGKLQKVDSDSDYFPAATDRICDFPARSEHRSTGSSGSGKSSGSDVDDLTSSGLESRSSRTAEVPKRPSVTFENLPSESESSRYMVNDGSLARRQSIRELLSRFEKSEDGERKDPLLRPVVPVASSTIAERRRTFQPSGLNGRADYQEVSPPPVQPRSEFRGALAAGTGGVVLDRKSVVGTEPVINSAESTRFEGKNGGATAAQKGKFMTRSSVFGNPVGNFSSSVPVPTAPIDVVGVATRQEFGAEFTRLPDRRRVFEASGD